MTALVRYRSLGLACLAACSIAQAQSPAGGSDAITVTALRDPVDKSYRRMIAGMERFEKRRHLRPPHRFASNFCRAIALRAWTA